MQRTQFILLFSCCVLKAFGAKMSGSNLSEHIVNNISTKRVFKVIPKETIERHVSYSITIRTWHQSLSLLYRLAYITRNHTHWCSLLVFINILAFLSVFKEVSILVSKCLWFQYLIFLNILINSRLWLVLTSIFLFITNHRTLVYRIFTKIGDWSERHLQVTECSCCSTIGPYSQEPELPQNC